MRKSCFLILLLIACAESIGAQGAPIDQAKAAQYFDEAKRISAADGGRLWGVALYGPMFFVNAATSEVVANQADAEGKLTRHGAVWTGKLPPQIGAANTSIQWAGVRWTMVMWPLPIYRRDRAALMMHECFHRVQAQVGLPARDAVNSQLDTRDGRIWLELEWRALEHALTDFGDQAKRNRAIADALLFRAWRRSLFSGAWERENALEMNEGLAEYTGARLANPAAAEMRVAAIEALHEARGRRSFVRSFAYVSGPAYGALLDSAAQPPSAKPWRKTLTPDSDFGLLLARVYPIPAVKPSETEVNARLAAYDGDEIVALETERDARRKTMVAAARARFVDGPVLVLPAVKDMGYSFDPNNVLSLDDNLTLYIPVKVSDEWGVLECENGAVLVRENGRLVRAQIPAPAEAAARPVKLEGCKLELHAGWTLGPGERAGDFVVVAAK
ncbi:MAG TPA: hypothetical protein VMI93_02965 [Candidatus Solibacter sp.]|nr:hypothetical protein [Candidatus Solibacter sp.]